MNLKPKFWNSDKIVSISAILISLTTMAIYLYQTHLMKKQQNAAVMPYIRVMYSFDHDRFEVLVLNEGLGPAFIDEVNTYYMGKKYEHQDLPDFFQNEYTKIDSTLSLNYSNISEDMLFTAGKTLWVVSTKNSEEKAQKLYDLFLNNKIEMEITFSSIYGEKWKVRGVSKRPEKISD
ncbi:hypothetical protein [Arcicella aurantiaca]|nr:hypothetical protein [Arcicella aurantiaca]